MGMRILIAGAGKLGYKVAEALSSNGHDITVIDVDERALQRVNNNLDVLTAKGNAAQLEILEQFNMARTHVTVAVTDSDETNLLICMLAKELGCARVAARVRDPAYAKQLDFFSSRFAVDFIINPDKEVARDVMRYLLQGGTLHIEQFAHGRVGLVEYPVSFRPELAGCTLTELDVFRGILVAAISREGEIIVPHGSTELADKDVLYLIGKTPDLKAFSGEGHSAPKKNLPRSVMILGGGNAGFYLANDLQETGAAVKIIEQDEERSAYLAENLRNVLVIHGDGSDHDLLEEENLAEMDALVALTGVDEENLLLALLGKQQGISKVVAKVSRSNFISIIEQLGIDRAVNPVLISAAAIMRFIEGGQIASLSLLFGGQAEVVEIIVTEASQVIGVSLRDLNLPQGIIVGAVVRGGQVTIPTGDTVIQAGDRVVVFCVASLVHQLEKLFYRQKGGLFRELWHGRKDPGKSPAN
jgi:trk system potassium uptake protein TrkA